MFVNVSSMLFSIVKLISFAFNSWFLNAYIACLWSFATSSYSSRFFLASKFLASILLCAFSIPLDNILCSIGSSPIPIFSNNARLLSVINNLKRSSSSDKKNLEYPGSPCLPDLPLSWLSILLDSCLSVPRMWRPPASNTNLWLFNHASSSWSSFFPPKTISVPRPAIFVAIVTTPGFPAFAITSASLSWCFALSIWWLILDFFKKLDTSSDDSTETVPINTGPLFLVIASTSLINALYFADFVKNTKSLLSFLTIGLFVGITTTSSP